MIKLTARLCAVLLMGAITGAILAGIVGGVLDAMGEPEPRPYYGSVWAEVEDQCPPYTGNVVPNDDPHGPGGVICYAG